MIVVDATLCARVRDTSSETICLEVFPAYVKLGVGCLRTLEYNIEVRHVAQSRQDHPMLRGTCSETCNVWQWSTISVGNIEELQEMLNREVKETHAMVS